MTSPEHQISRKNEKGFTLVELAIVMIIIGLLIGGILKGQELIVNAQVTNAVSQIKGLDGAVATFRDSYNAFPGDMGNAESRIAGCTAATNCNNGDGDGRLDTDMGNAPAAGDETVGFFNHMRAADLITGLDGTGAAVAFGTLLPSAAIGGGYFAGHTSAGVTGFDDSTMRAGHYIVLTGVATEDAGSDDSGALTPSQAARIDRKVDDGMPESGTVHGDDGGDCKDSATPAVYNETQAAELCAIAIRIQG